MKKFYLFLPLLALISVALKGADKPAYTLFTINGKPTTYTKMLEEAKKADVVLFGEYHNNPICHWLQYELTNDLYKAYGDKVVLGAEMFEADNQRGLNRYLSGEIADTQLRRVVRLWPNYYPLLGYCCLMFYSLN